MISYWEQDHWFSNIDFTIIGGGFTGHFTALALRQKQPDADILLIERDAIGAGASTKNAGFACFGSVGEILDDLNDEHLDTALSRVHRRFKGLQQMRSIIPDSVAHFEQTGGIELFQVGEEPHFQTCLDHIQQLNEELKPLLGFEPYAEVSIQSFGFHDIIGGISIKNEGMLQPAKALAHLRALCSESKIKSLYGISVKRIESQNNEVTIETDRIKFRSAKVILATNAFTPTLTDQAKSKSARGQVLITSPIENLPFSGTFHMDLGYYYFRNVGNRVLLGGARNLDYSGEESDEIKLNESIQRHLEETLHTTILPGKDFSIDQRWSGIMAFGANGEKEPIISEIEPNIFTAYRLGGMGVALSAQVGEEAAALASRK